jgi:hypothetical protein
VDDDKKPLKFQKTNPMPEKADAASLRIGYLVTM